MNKQTIVAQLKILGLDEIEIKIYLNLLEGYQKTPLDLSRETNINRSKIYRYIEKLKQKQLIEQFTIDRGIKLEAASPDTLQLLIFEKEQQLKIQKDLLPDLINDLSTLSRSLKNPFEVKYYHGDEGMKQMLWNQLSAKKELLIFSYETRNEIVGKPFAEKVREEQVRRKLTLYEIENVIDPPGYLFTNVRDWEKYYFHRHVPEEVLTIHQNTAIFNDTVAVMSWTNDQKIGFELVNSAYALMQKQLFWYFWNKVAEFKELRVKK